MAVQEGVEVGPGEELLGDLSVGKVVQLGLPVVFEADDQTPVVHMTRP